ncbi:uncharacterized protein LOC106166755 [Lingula anatina]|uniref:Uncharacterized protein LOC106166755 n=1 Tax=Lingula anatina TaxID=7574 RepID=A0A1S3ISE0_LINAN|nr:uncharacterized protein LOC106166755 [Lingula anatina]|eukprot:XP_013400856.1 uncharacterized protein LOC106166755 [Lingula anatina]
MGSDFDRNVYIVAIVTSSLSCVGCFVVFAAWIFLKDTRSTGRRLLLFLTTADLLTAVGNLIGASWALELSSSGRPAMNSSQALHSCQYPNGICVVQSFLSSVGSLASFFWTMLIAWQVRETLVGERSSWMDKPKYQWLLHLLAWGVPVLILTAAAADGKLGYWQSSENHTSLIPKTTTVSPNMSMTFFYHETAYPSLDATKPRQDNTVVVAVDGHAENAAFEGGGYSGSKEDLLRGSTAGWCWIKICEGDELHWGLVVFLTLLTGKGWEMVAYIVVPTIYFNIKGKLQRTVLKASASRLDKAVLEAVKKAHRAMTAVPLMFIALRIWGTIRYVANITVWITGSSTEPWFEVLFNKIFLVLHCHYFRHRVILNNNQNYTVLAIITIRTDHHGIKCYQYLWSARLPVHCQHRRHHHLYPFLGRLLGHLRLVDPDEERPDSKPTHASIFNHRRFLCGNGPANGGKLDAESPPAFKWDKLQLRRP